MSGLPKSGHLWAIYEYSPSSQMIALRGLSLRTPAPSLLSLGRRAEVALSFSAPTLVVTVLHDNALIVLAARLVIDALALSIDVAFDRTTGRETLRVIPVRGIRRFLAGQCLKGRMLVFSNERRWPAASILRPRLSLVIE